MVSKTNRLISIDPHLDDIAKKAIPNFSSWVERHLKRDLCTETYLDELINHRKILVSELKDIDNEISIAGFEVELRKIEKEVRPATPDLRIDRYIQIIKLHEDNRLSEGNLKELLVGLPNANSISNRLGTDKWPYVITMLKREVEKAKSYAPKR
jgi:hypothetical protein